MKTGFLKKSCGIALIAACFFASAAASTFVLPKKITVVTDFNYPPYLFTKESRELQGVVVDKWQLWSQKTGIPVQVIGMHWVAAQNAVQAGEVDVIEAIVYTPERAMLYEYSEPYAPITAHVYFHESIGGINDIDSMRGFKIAAKQGSACGSWLAQQGIEPVLKYATSELLVQAVRKGEERLFCMDSMAAQYYLFKYGLAGEFRVSPPLYVTQFHWAVRKGRKDLLDFIQSGFEKITLEEIETINRRWVGNPLRFPVPDWLLYYSALVIALVLTAYAVLIISNLVLRRRVSLRTAELHGTSLWLQQAVSAGNIGLFDWDINSNKVQYSAEWKRQIGYDDTEISGDFSEWQDRVHPDDIERTLASVRAHLEKLTPEYQVEFRFRHKDGSYRWILATAAVQFDRRGKPARVLGAHTDMTDYKRNGALLEGQKQVLELIAEGRPLEQVLDTLLRVLESQAADMLCSILLFDPVDACLRHGAAPSLPRSYMEAIDGEPIGDNAGSCGTAAFRRQNIVVEDIATDPLWDKYRSFALEHDLRACWSTPIFDQKRQVLGTFAMYFRTPRRPSELHLQLIGIATHTAAIAIGKRNEQEALREREQALREANEQLQLRIRELARSNLDLQQFAYIASHDLQTPLRGISGFLQLLADNYRGKLDTQADEWIGRAVASTQRMQHLIRDLLEYSRVDSRARTFQVVDFGHVYEEVVRTLEPSISEIKAEVTHGDLPSLLGDRSLLVQLLQNLLSNAVKYHADRPLRIHVGAEKKDGKWVFSVTDNGIGIDKKHHESIFQIFRRLHTQQDYPGSGIGLAICQRIVHFHGGEIWVRSELNAGSTFFFTIPERAKQLQELSI